MQKPERRKNYKAKDPVATVEEIRNILRDLDIPVTEKLHENEEADVYSCTVSVDGFGIEKLDASTNGKGMTRDYSLASGYAEFMERLQNGVLLGIENAVFLESTTVKADKCGEDITVFFKDNFGEDERASGFFLNNCPEFKMITFESIPDGDTIRVPIEILLRMTTSNGMCAGNNRSEAVLQGVSEIFERYAQKRIFMEKLCPPDIPEELFEGTEVLDKLRMLRKKGIEFRIKDCSLGIGIPVVGVYLVLPDGRELFHLGADPSPITSLERSLTEVFQGVDSVEEANFSERDTEEHDETFWKYQLQLTSWGGNICPPQIGAGKADWEFQGFIHPVSFSNEDDMSWYLELIDTMGKKLYIRDVSYSGFCSYFCYIPSLSNVDFAFDKGEELARYYELSDSLKNARRLPKLSKPELKEFALAYSKYLSEFWYCEDAQRRFFPRGLIALPDEADMLVARMYAAAGMNNNAAEKMEDFLLWSECEESKEEMLEDFIMLMRTGKCIMKDTEKMTRLDDGAFPVCGDCRECGLINRCHQAEIKEFNSHLLKAELSKK